MNSLKESAISYILNHPETDVRTIFLSVRGNFEANEKNLRDFRRSLADWKNEYNSKQLDNVIKGLIRKDSAVMIVSSKGGGFKAARTKDERVQGFRHYVSTLKTEAENARVMSRFIEIVDNQRLQYLLNFEKEQIEETLF